MAFIPIFVAVDAVGILPIFTTLTTGQDVKQKKHIIFQSLLTALLLGTGFVLLGKLIFKFLGITIGDFMVAGGAVLFIIAIMDIMNPGKKYLKSDPELGVVPLGTPLIVGPAVLTTSLILLDQFGFWFTFASLLANILIAGLTFMTADFWIRIIGEAGSRALSKFMHLLLAAIAVMMVRKGVILILTMLKIC